MSKARETDPAELWERYCEETLVARRTPQGAMAFAFDALTPAIRPQQMRETAAEAIRTFCKSLGNNVVVVSSDDVERIYYSGISIDALSAAIAIALTRPECGEGQ